MEYLKSSKDVSNHKLTTQHTTALQQFQKRYLSEIDAMEKSKAADIESLNQTHEKNLVLAQEMLNAQDAEIKSMQAQKEQTMQQYMNEVSNMKTNQTNEIHKHSLQHDRDMKNAQKRFSELEHTNKTLVNKLELIQKKLNERYEQFLIIKLLVEMIWCLRQRNSSRKQMTNWKKVHSIHKP